MPIADGAPFTARFPDARRPPLHCDRLVAFFQYGGKLSLSWLDAAPAAVG